jgi:hypothetical protein
MGKPKHRKRPRRRWYLWRRIARYYVSRAVARMKSTADRVAGPKVVAQASQDWSDGEFVRPVLQPLRLNRYVAPTDMERYRVLLGGCDFELERLPDPTADLREDAYAAAAAQWGVFVHSLPLELIEPLNDLATAALPEPITA